jgi:hypothetical protein
MAQPSGTEVVRVAAAEAVSQLNDWVHDGYLEDALQFSAGAARAIIPFAQESGWGSLHSSMSDPQLVTETFLARHYEVPLTRCYIIVEHAERLEADIDWGNPSLDQADFSDSTFRLTTGSFARGVSVAVTDVDIRVLVSSEEAGRLYRKVLRFWPAESDRWLTQWP